MTAKGHVVLASVLAYMPVTYAINNYSYTEAIISYLVILVGSLLPDIDEPNSYIGKKTFHISSVLKILGLKHRSITHWLITPLLIVTVGMLIDSNLIALVLFSVAFGILAHDIGDLLTYGGINGFFFPFFPNRKAVLLPKILRFETFSITEKVLILILLGVNFLLYYKLLIHLF